MQHMCVYFANQAAAAALASLAIIPGSRDTVQNNRYFAPEDMQIQAVAAFGANMTRTRLDAPAIRRYAPVDVQPFTVGTALGTDGNIDFSLGRKLQLYQGESLDVQTSNNAGGAVAHYALVFFAGNDGAIPRGEDICLRGVSATTLVANAWTNVVINWDNALPAGDYLITGLYAQSATGVACRVSTPSVKYSPGVPAITALGQRLPMPFEMNMFGNYGQFNTNSYPNFEWLATGADTAQTIFMKLRAISPRAVY